MGREPGEDVLAREFFIGPDDDDTNKDIHAAVVVQEREDGSDTMSLSFNILKRSAEDRRVKLFGEARTVVVRVRAADVELMKSDCRDKELERLAAGLLQAIRDKKRILRERHNPGPPRA